MKDDKISSDDYTLLCLPINHKFRLEYRQGVGVDCCIRCGYRKIAAEEEIEQWETDGLLVSGRLD